METDVLVIGTGIAGLMSSICLAEAGFNVIVITKSDSIKESNTYLAQGGIVYSANKDDHEHFKQDILKSGCYINNISAVDMLVKEGYKYLKEYLITKIKVNFEKTIDNKFEFTREAAHSKNRIIYATDSTGKSIIEALINYIQKFKNIKILTNHMAVDLLTLEHHATNNYDSIYKPNVCVGAYVFNVLTSKVIKIISKVTILATGGLGEIYKYSTNSKVATGDGYAMAWRAGAKLINMEYTQFHPTVFYIQDKSEFLISEALRGEGAVLKTLDGKEFMQNYHKLKSLAPRDIISRAIHKELLKKHNEYVLLDAASYIQAEKIKKRFPNIYNQCLKYGIDITKQPIPVIPAFHFLCGGIRVDTHAKTDIERLFAIGEICCTGLHGANRLASTSLLEALTLAVRASKYITNHWDFYKRLQKIKINEWDDSGLTETIDPALVKQDWLTIKNIMWNYVGLVRSTKRLRRAIADLRHLQEIIEDFYRNSKLTKELIELRNGIQSALIITYSAWSNRKSIGCHYRE